MIHYHGSPLSGKRVDAARFYSGRHALVSFAHQQDLPIIADACQSFVLDNGAFSHWKKGGRVDVDSYISWVREWSRHPGFDWCLIPDVIDGDESENAALLNEWPDDLAGVPVWHLHESLDYLDMMVSAWPRIALGSSGNFTQPGTETWWRRMSEAMEVICEDGAPRCKLHGLRMLNPQIFQCLPLSSADSTNATQNAGTISGFGMYLPPTAAQRAEVIAARIESHNSAAVWSTYKQEEIFQCGQ